MGRKLIMNEEFLKEIKDTVETVKCKLEKLQSLYDSIKSENVRWRAEKGRAYWWVTSNGEISLALEQCSEKDTYLHMTGNYFRTEQQAQEYKENLITKQKLKDLALRLNNGVEINWDELNNFFIFYDYDLEELKQNYAIHCADIGQVYCLDAKFLNIAKQEIGEQALIKLIKSGV